METLYIKCPKCGKVLAIHRQPGLENMNVPCPVCKNKSPFFQFEKVQPKQHVSDTVLPENLKPTKISLVDCVSGTSYELPVGVNTVGRGHPTSAANVQIATKDMGMSRVHSTIEVLKTTTGNLRCIISNALNKNATCINGKKLEDGNKIFLNNGDIVKMSRSEFKVEIE